MQKKSNQALQYYDVELILVLNLISSKQDLWVMKIIFVFLKKGYKSLNL